MILETLKFFVFFPTKKKVKKKGLFFNMLYSKLNDSKNEVFPKLSYVILAKKLRNFQFGWKVLHQLPVRHNQLPIVSISYSLW